MVEESSIPHSDTIEMIQNLQNQVNSLQQKIIELEAKIENALRGTLEASKSPLKQYSKPEQYKIPSNQDKALNGPNFITSEDPGKISEQERIQIIQTGLKVYF